MGTTAEKLQYLIETKDQIKQAIIDKGVGVGDTDTFRSYATKISEIQSGGGGERDPNETMYEMMRTDFLQQQMGLISYTDIPTEEEYLEQQTIVNNLIEKITGVAFNG